MNSDPEPADIIDWERPDTRPQCLDCGRTFVDADALTAHRKAKHSTESNNK